ncbi:galectin-3-binding protein-like isoform X1 [Hypanus sabinus]|uniref:galectin-3-binding protein-like isoform X1 n=2 Tax=Hypanus sabinus TaxID=79690 RepID=UPI0028C46372|nr:galectin-3-binding protein-like isoform X1 [Hypanus sabinus]
MDLILCPLCFVPRNKMTVLPALALMFLLLGLGEGLESGELRLSSGRLPSEGRVEVYYDGEWGTVCDDGWDLTDAHVVCRSLGYLNATEAVAGGFFGSGSGPILLDDVSCTGTETSLADCKTKGWKIHDCQHSEDAGVRCDPRRLDQLFGYRLDLTSEFYKSLEELYESHRDCDMNITVSSLEDGREEARFCVHRLILSLHTDGNLLSQSQGSCFNLLVSQDCVQYVDDIIRYFYTKTISVTLSSVKCIHNIASDYRITAVRDYCDQLFYKLMPQDSSFQQQLELYKYAGRVKDPVLQEICLQYFSWNCETFSQTVAWDELSVTDLAALLQRSDLVIESEFTLFQAVESWISRSGQTDAVGLLMKGIRFPMMSPEELISLPFNSSLYQQFESVFTQGVLEAFEFHSVRAQVLKYFKDLNTPDFQPRIYTSKQWSRTLAIPGLRDSAYQRTGLYGPTPSYYNRQQRYYGRYNSYYYSSPRVSFRTKQHMSQLFSSSTLQWTAYYHSTAQHCRNSYVSCPYDTYPVAVLTTYNTPETVTYRNSLLLLCNNSTVSYVQEMKNSTAVLPSHNNTDFSLFACDDGISTLQFVVRPFYV